MGWEGGGKRLLNVYWVAACSQRCAKLKNSLDSKRREELNLESFLLEFVKEQAIIMFYGHCH